MSRVLVAEDDHRIRRSLTLTLQARGYDVGSVPDGQSALNAVEQAMPDLLVLDLGLPDMDGTQVIEQVRRWSTVPILVLTAREREEEKIHALDAGADDYITKPFGMGELLARVRAALRRTALTGQAQVVSTAAFSIDLADKRVRRPDGADVRLTPIEWAILAALAQRPGALVSQHDLLHEVWGPQYGSETHYLRVYIAQLRRKLEPDPTRPRFLLTERGRGYRLDTTDRPPTRDDG
jgi:two-component system KDP operon response regulator KdpE